MWINVLFFLNRIAYRKQYLILCSPFQISFIVISSSMLWHLNLKKEPEAAHRLIKHVFTCPFKKLYIYIYLPLYYSKLKCVSSDKISGWYYYIQTHSGAAQKGKEGPGDVFCKNRYPCFMLFNQVLIYPSTVQASCSRDPKSLPCFSQEPGNVEKKVQEWGLVEQQHWICVFSD